LLLALPSYLYHKGLFGWIGLHHSQGIEVSEVSSQTHDTWTLKMRPIRGNVRPYLPGQFHFLTLHRQGSRDEEHPYTISSAPAEDGFLASTIKASGDFTRTIGSTQVGDRVSVRGPYGRFSPWVETDATDLVFLAFGVGITPFRSILRHLAETDDIRRVLLVYGNRTEKDIIFKTELDEIAQRANPTLRVIYVLSKPEEEWAGERGHIDLALLRRLLAPRASDRRYYLCGPVKMMADTQKALKALGVAEDHIFFEQFAL
jgi:ferredoxin-NADP reductase